MEDSIIEANLGDSGDGEYVKTIENTPYTYSIILMKTDDVDTGNLLLSAQRLLNQNVCTNGTSNFSKRPRKVSKTHRKLNKSSFMETLQGKREDRSSKALTTKVNLEDLVDGSKNSSSKASTTEVNLGDMVEGEYVETTDNTLPPTNTCVKKESSDVKCLLGPPHDDPNQSAVAREIKSSPTGSENSSLEDSTTEVNLRSSGEGEYIKTTDNTLSSLSNSLVKDEDSEMKSLTDAHQDKVKENDGDTPVKSEHGDWKDFLPMPSTNRVQVMEEIVDKGNDLVTVSITTFFTPLIEVEDPTLSPVVKDNKLTVAETGVLFNPSEGLLQLVTDFPAPIVT